MREHESQLLSFLPQSFCGLASTRLKCPPFPTCHPQISKYQSSLKPLSSSHFIFRHHLTMHSGLSRPSQLLRCGSAGSTPIVAQSLRVRVLGGPTAEARPFYWPWNLLHAINSLAYPRGKHRALCQQPDPSLQPCLTSPRSPAGMPQRHFKLLSAKTKCFIQSPQPALLHSFLSH